MYSSERWGWRDGSLALCDRDWGTLGPADAWKCFQSPGETSWHLSRLQRGNVVEGCV